MRCLIFIWSALTLLTSCVSLQEINEVATRVQEIQIEIADDCNITKDGIIIGTTTIAPTYIRPNVNGIRYPSYVGVTITTRF